MEDARGTLSLEEANFRTRSWLVPAQHVSLSTIRRLEQGDEAHADPVLVWALSKVYDVPLEELSPVAAEWFKSVRQAGCMHPDAGHDRRAHAA